MGLPVRGACLIQPSRCQVWRVMITLRGSPGVVVGVTFFGEAGAFGSTRLRITVKPGGGGGDLLDGGGFGSSRSSWQAEAVRAFRVT